MPIKLPKGLKPKRKSSAQVLEEVENTPAPSSFRVIERGHSKSFDGFSGGSRLMASTGRPLTYHPTDSSPENPYNRSENSDPRYDMRRVSTQPILMDDRRKSGMTIDSYSTGQANHSAASSMRLSAASTVPSSTDLPLDAQRQPLNLRKPLPDPNAGGRLPQGSSRPGFSGKASSSGLRSITPNSTDMLPHPPQRRHISTTPSSASTATPPRLSDFDLRSDMDDFGNMFDALDKRKSIATTNTDSPSSVVLPSYANPRSRTEDSSQSRCFAPSPISVDRTTHVEPSPMSWASQHSDDRLMASSSPGPRSPQTMEQTPLSKKAPPSSWQHGSALGSSAARSDASIRRTPSPLKEVSNFEPQSTSRIWGGNAYQSSARSPSPTKHALVEVVSRSSREDRGRRRSKEDDEIEAAIIDTTLAASARLAADFENQPPSPDSVRSKPPHKVMTPAQFERYRQEQESKRQSGLSLADHSDDDNQDEDDVDEAERHRQAMKQRRKQEAHLSVYRQQMMKVTGEKSEAPAVSVTRPVSNRASTSLPNLSSRMSAMNLAPGTSPSSGLNSGEEDEDEDVPLGILQAHGFPNKNRPPTRLSSFRPVSSINLKSESQPNLVGSASVSGDGPRKNLPEFARKLPKDPYYGAGIVNPSNRESFALGGGVPTRGLTPPGLPPGGLVGVIAGEERARAIRRGSPQPEPTMQQGMPYGMPPVMSPGEQAQLQMQAQMNQMMQMQMQWMQMMMQNPGQVPPMGTPPMPGQMPGQMQPWMPRTASSSSLPMMQPGEPPMQPPSHLAPVQEQRSMSMLNPQAAPWNRPMSTYMGGAPSSHQPYAGSIAPSERSNIGLAPRYRPVSIAPPANQNRASTFTSATPSNWQSATMPQSQKHGISTVRPVLEEDEDEQAWTEMKRKRDERKNARRSKKDQQELASLYPSGM